MLFAWSAPLYESTRPIRLHFALIDSRLVFASSFSYYGATVMFRRARIHRVGFKRAQGISQQTATTATLGGGQVLSLQYPPKVQVMGQLIHRHEITLGRQFLDYVVDHTCYRYASALHNLRLMLPYLWLLPFASPPMPPWWIRGPTYVEVLKDVRRTRVAPLVVAAAAQGGFGISYSNHLHIYTDAWV